MVVVKKSLTKLLQLAIIVNSATTMKLLRWKEL